MLDYGYMAMPMVQVNVRVPPELHAWLMREAKTEGASVTAVVTAALLSYRDGRREKGEA